MLEPDDAVVLVAQRGEHDDRQRRAVGAQPAAHLKAVDARQHQVQHHQVRWVLARTYQRGVAVRDLGRTQAGSAEVAGDDLRHGLVVFDHEHVSRGARRESTRAP